MIQLHLDRQIRGSILDIGGGGEGVIGRIYTDQVTAIDNRQEELDEAPDCCEKLCMDASDLQFPDKSFDNVTFFYSLMYMTYEMKLSSLSEALRVLKPGGCIYIWDGEIESAYPDAHLVDLEITYENHSITTTYGVLGTDMEQNMAMFIDFAEKQGLNVISQSQNSDQFFVVFKK